MWVPAGYPAGPHRPHRDAYESDEVVDRVPRLHMPARGRAQDVEGSRRVLRQGKQALAGGARRGNVSFLRVATLSSALAAGHTRGAIAPRSLL
jgi:hypothetical protein